MPTPGSFADTVKQQADIVRIIGDYIKLKKSGAQNFTGLCPFHNEKTPSFSVHASRQFYHCFGCAASGDVFSFVQKIEDITFPEAVRLVAQKLGIAIPQQTPSGPAEAREAQLRAKLLDLHERACVFFQEQLKRPEAARAREYLAGRGLTPEIIAQFRIGYAPESGFLLRDRLQPHADEDTLKVSGLLAWKQADAPPTSVAPSSAIPSAKPAAKPSAKPGAPPALYSKFRDRIMFPIGNESGRIIAFTGRALSESPSEKSGPKYLNSPETAIYSKSRVLFNLDRAKEFIRKLDYAILVEGQMDCISVFAAGFHNVIASSGTAFTDAQARLLARCSKKIVVNFDPDTAGAAAAERSLSLLVMEDFRIKVLTLESGYDPDLFIRRQGKDAYAAVLRAAPDYFDYLIERARSMFRIHTAEGKVQAVNFLLPHLQRVNSAIYRDELAINLAQKLAIDSAVLRQELKRAVGTRAATVKVDAGPATSEAEKLLIRALASPDETLRAAARDALTQESLHLGLSTESLLAALLEKAATAPSRPLDPTSLELADSDRRLLASLLMQDSEPLSPQLLQLALQALRQQKLEGRFRQVQAELRKATGRRDDMEQARLAQEELKLRRELVRFTSSS
jgi:DNA primase